MLGKWLTIIGIGEDGWDGLATDARNALERAEVVIGGARQLAFLPQLSSKRLNWPSPMIPFITEMIERYRGRTVAVLASGDPLLYGVGALLTARLDASEYVVIPHLSSFTLACARLGWPSAETPLISAVHRPLERLLREATPGRRLIVLSEDGLTPAAVASLLVQHGYGKSAITVLERLGGPYERRHDGVAASWERRCDDLNIVAVTCIADGGVHVLSNIPGLPESAYETDGQITKREIRAAAIARLAPSPGELLWDVGSGTGSIAVEWMRAHPACRSIAFEKMDTRAERIARNARSLGVPDLRVVHGMAPDAFDGLPQPHAIFIGGGITTPGLLQGCLQRIAPGGRIVAHAVTIEGEATLVRAQALHGGELIRIAVSHAEPLGTMSCWRPQLPVTEWCFQTL